MSTRFAVALLILCVSLPSLVDAQGVPKEVALASTFKDAQLKWGPCPPFIPKGCEIAVLHGDPAKANADVFFKVPGDFTIPDHWHTSAERMVEAFYCLALLSVGKASTADSNAMNSTHGSPFAQDALCGSLDGPYAYMPGLNVIGF